MQDRPSHTAEIRAGEIGPLARHLRERRGLSLREAAGELVVSISSLSEAERGAQRLVQLALRSANFHLARAAEDGLAEAGEIRDIFLAEGGAVEALGHVRSPEADRRAGLLRQALLARDIEMRTDGRRAVVEFSDVLVSVNLMTMMVNVSARMVTRPPSKEERKQLGAGGFIAPDPATGKDDQEDWARAINRFAGAVAEAGAQEPFDGRAVQRVLRRRGSF